MYGKAKVGKPDWYMMGICIVFALTFSLRSVPLAVLLLLFMPFSLLSLTGELLDYHIKCNTTPKKERHCVRFVLE